MSANNALQMNPASVDTTSISGPGAPNASGTGWFSDKNGIIIFLLVIVILSFLGVNLLIVSGNALGELTKIFGPVVQKVASMLGYSAGHLVNTTADITADTAKFSVDIAEGTAQSVGNLLKNASKGGMDEGDRRNLEKALTSPKCPSTQSSPSPSQSADSIHRPITAKKNGWCFVGEDAGSRGCVSIEEHDKCMSGQIFPTKEACLAPSQ
jgi:hypothetical protein